MSRPADPHKIREGKYILGELTQETPESKTSPRGRLERALVYARFEVKLDELQMKIGDQEYYVPIEVIEAAARLYREEYPIS